MVIANALQLEAARRRAGPIPFNTSPGASLKSLSLSVAVLEHIYCWYATLLWPWTLTPWPWPLTPWPWTFVVVRASCVQTLCKIWAKANNPLQRYWRFSTLSPWKFLRGSRLHEMISGVRGPNFTKLGGDIRPTSLLTKFASELRYIAAFSNAGRSNSRYVENDAKFRSFWPPVKLGEG